MEPDPKADGQLAQAFFQGVSRLPMKALNFDHDLSDSTTDPYLVRR